MVGGGSLGSSATGAVGEVYRGGGGWGGDGGGSWVVMLTEGWQEYLGIFHAHFFTHDEERHEPFDHTYIRCTKSVYFPPRLHIMSTPL